MVWAACVADCVHLPNLRSSAHVLHLKPELVYRPRWWCGIGWWLSRSFKLLPKVGRHPCRILMISYLVLVNAQRQSICTTLSQTTHGDQFLRLSFAGFSLLGLLGGCAQLCGWCIHLHSCLGDEVIWIFVRDLLPTWSIARSWVCWKDPDSSEELGNRKQQGAGSCHNVSPLEL